MTKGNTNRNKGFSAERLYAKIFREMGFNKCCTTRQSSRLLDSCKIDLDFIPFNIQIKAGRQKNMNPSKILSEVQDNLSEKYEIYNERHKYPTLLIHHKQGTSGKKRNIYDTLVTMTFQTFCDHFLIKFLNK